MTIKEYFGDWTKVIDPTELSKILKWLKTIDRSLLCPEPKNIFKAFQLCPYDNCKVIMLGQDPYPQKEVATGVLFGNSTSVPILSPSLQILKEAVIDYTIPHNIIEFDNSLESWAKQGILMINTALTCEVNKVGSHFHVWKGFVSKLLENISSRDNGLIFMLFGSQASSFKDNIQGNHFILEEYHPAYYARKGIIMPNKIFKETNRILKNQYNLEIEFYKETEYGTC